MKIEKTLEYVPTCCVPGCRNKAMRNTAVNKNKNTRTHWKNECSYHHNQKIQRAKGTIPTVYSDPKQLYPELFDYASTTDKVFEELEKSISKDTLNIMLNNKCRLYGETQRNRGWEKVEPWERLQRAYIEETLRMYLKEIKSKILSNNS